MIIKRTLYQEREYSKKLFQKFKLSPEKKEAIKLWAKDRFTEGLEGKEKKTLENFAHGQKSPVLRYIFSPA